MLYILIFLLCQICYVTLASPGLSYIFANISYTTRKSINLSYTTGLSLWWYQRKHSAATKRTSQKRWLLYLWAQTDPIGLILVTASLVLVLLPMTLASRLLYSRSSPAIISMIVIGGVSFIAFVVYELYVPRYPILSLRLAKNRSVAAGYLIESFLFLSYYLWNSYIYSFLVVVNHKSPKAATNIVTSQGVATAATGLLISLVVKWTGNIKWVVLGAISIKMIGAGPMLRYSSPEANLAQLTFSQIVSGMGTGMISIVVQTAVQAVARHQDQSSYQFCFREEILILTPLILITCSFCDNSLRVLKSHRWCYRHCRIRRHLG